MTWTPALARRAVVWLAQTVQKPVLKLLDEHYSEHGMADLLTEQGPAYGPAATDAKSFVAAIT